MKNKRIICVAAFTILIIGGLNWGLVGLGMLTGSDLNVINALLGGWPTAEAIVYLLVGLAALKKVICIAANRHCREGVCK
ncbi:MAG: DUF378 domain-containing protein [Patescibacteria group bacterium]